MINFDKNEDEYNLIDFLKQGSEALKHSMKIQHDRMIDPCWKLERVYYVSQDVIDKLNDGTIKEWQIPLYSFESREVWVNECEDS